MQNDGLMKKKKALEEQLTQLRKTAKLGMLTSREFTLSEKRILKQLEETLLSLRLRDTKKKAVKELLKKEKEAIPVAHDSPKKKKHVKTKTPLQRKTASDEWLPFEQLQHLNVKDLKKKTEQATAKKHTVKKEHVKEILATLEKPEEKFNNLHKEKKGLQTSSDLKKIPVDTSSTAAADKKPAFIEDKKEQRAALVQEILRESIIPEQQPTLQDDSPDPTPGWKIAFVVLGLILVVLLYLKFSTPLVSLPLEVTLYGDYTCDTCAEVSHIFTELQNVYSRQLVVKHIIIARDDSGFLAGAATECAADQGQFLPYHEMLYSTLPELEQQISEQTLVDFAEELQLDVPLFTKCLQSDIKLPLLEKHKREALQQGINAVPTMVLGKSKKFVGLFSKEIYIKEINTLLGVTGGDSGLASVTTTTETE